MNSYTYENYKYYDVIKDQINYMNSLSEYEIKHIQLYTGAHGYNINKELRSLIKNLQYQNIITTIDDIFDKSPSLDQPIILWREISVDLGKKYKELRKDQNMVTLDRIISFININNLHIIGHSDLESEYGNKNIIYLNF